MSVEGIREKLRGAEGATVITKTKNIRFYNSSFILSKSILF